eukprot:Opistho-2@38553
MFRTDVFTEDGEILPSHSQEILTQRSSQSRVPLEALSLADVLKTPPQRLLAVQSKSEFAALVDVWLCGVQVDTLMAHHAADASRLVAIDEAIKQLSMTNHGSHILPLIVILRECGNAN